MVQSPRESSFLRGELQCATDSGLCPFLFVSRHRMQVSIVARALIVFNHICGCSVASRASPEKVAKRQRDPRGEQGINRESTRRPHSVRSGHSLFRLLYRWHSHGVSSDILSRRLRHLVHVRACHIYAGAHGVDCTRNTTTVLEAGRWLCLVNGWDGTYKVATACDSSYMPASTRTHTPSRTSYV